MNRYTLSLALFFVFNILLAQEKYDWENRTQQLKNIDAEAPLYTIKNFTKYDYVYEGESKDLVSYMTKHSIIKVNSDGAVENSNTIYISLSNVIDILEVKARTITKEGKVIHLDKSNIKELKDSNEKGYKIFALEGVEVGSEVEYLYTKKIYPQFFLTEFLQFSSPTKEASFVLSCPKNLEFDFRIYNSDKQVEIIDTLEDINIYKFTATNIEGLSEEEFSAYNASRMRLETKLAYNSANNNKSRLFTWSDAAKRIHSQVNDAGNKDLKLVKKFISSVGLDVLSTKEKVAKLEHHIKTNFYLDENQLGNVSSIDFILKNNFSDERGFVKLFTACLKELNVKHELVLTCDRGNKKFDKDFDTWNFLDEYLIYINDINEYLAPYSFEYRLGTVPAELTATNGLFIKEVKVRDFFYPIGEVKYIPANSYAHNMDNLDVEVFFNEDLETNTVKVKRTFKGRTSSYVKSYYNFMEEDKKKELLNNFMQYLAADADITSSRLVDPKFDYKGWSDPLVIEADFKTSSYFDLAGDVILFKAGELIGAQSELYQDKERKTNVENDYNRGYLRKLVVNIPEGYKIENPEDLEMDFSSNNENGTVYLFKSAYSLENNKLLVEIEEYYDEIYWPLSDFESFRKVINAAADFNKVTLVLKKI